MDNIKRGEMFYISRGGVSYNGSEQHSDRPAVVVSNDKNNENSNVVAGTYKVTASGLNLRAGAGTGKSILAVMKNGEKVQCYGYYNDCNGVKWLYVVYKNIVGYASSKYLSK